MTSSRLSPADFLPLHPLAFRVLLSVVDGPSFGTEIVQRIENVEQAGKRLYPANLYRRVRDLLADGLLEECGSPEGADPRRTYVRLTALGRGVAEAEARRLRDLVVDAEALDLLTDA
jgi:DNA-binding PadR family transcriptional regulator